MKTVKTACALACLLIAGASVAQADGMTLPAAAAKAGAHCYLKAYGAGSFINNNTEIVGASVPLGNANLGFGVQPGCDYISGAFLAGVFADYTWNRGNTDVKFGGATILGMPQGNEWSAGVRAGVFASPSTLLYGLVAYTAQQDKGATMMGSPLSFSGPKGVAIGGGIETALSKQTTLSLEYRHVAFDTSTTTLVPITFDRTENVARVGVSFHFGSAQGN